MKPSEPTGFKSFGKHKYPCTSHTGVMCLRPWGSKLYNYRIALNFRGSKFS